MTFLNFNGLKQCLRKLPSNRTATRYRIIGVNKLLCNEGENPASRMVEDWETNSMNRIFKALVVA